MKKWQWFWSKYPAPQAAKMDGMQLCRQVYMDVMNKFAVTLRMHNNECLREYFGAVLLELNTKLYGELEAGKIPAERLLGGLDVLGSAVDILYSLEREHSKEHKDRQTNTFTEDGK